MNNVRRKRKGSFSGARLPVAARYLIPTPRRALLISGLLAAAGFLAYISWDFLARRGEVFSGGPLSSAHALLESDCAACHQPFQGVSSDSCSTCHEKYGDELGVYTYASHYVYRSNDFQRLGPSEHEEPCSACHQEHLGRDAEITRVADARCQSCHDIASLADGHPPFQHEAEPLSDDRALQFGHVAHVAEVMDRQGLLDIEKACLTCHNSRADGASFEPIDFDRHCDACHLTTSIRTPRLPIREGSDVGVRTLEDIQSRRSSGSEWAFYTNPNEFRVSGGRVMKTLLHHEDPWILENLRELRATLYPNAGLGDLLKASADVDAGDGVTQLYREAVATLEQRVLGLRSRPEPEVQDELARIDALLLDVRRALRDPFTPLDETEFLLSPGIPDPALGAERVAEIEDLVTDLTQPCAQCHTVEQATFQRVQKDQGVLRRANFDHRSHILQARCLDCHGGIPIQQALDGAIELSAEEDQAAIQNLPGIASCQECHGPGLTSDSCVTCHDFHPDKSRRSELLLYLD